MNTSCAPNIFMKQYICIISFNPYNKLMNWIYIPPFIDDESKCHTTTQWGIQDLKSGLLASQASAYVKLINREVS